MTKNNLWPLCLLSLFLMLSLQSCLSFGGDTTFQGNTTAKNGNVGINTTNQAKFKGQFYLTLDRNLYVLDNKANLTQLTHNIDVRDPMASPDGKWIAFIARSKYYSDLDYISTNAKDTTVHTIVTGNGHYFPKQDGANNYYWFAQPSWSADSTKILFLSDLQKAGYWAVRGIHGVFDSYFLDLQVFALPFGGATLNATQALQQAQAVGYANFGDGGNRDPAYRPGHPEQVLYTHYSYDQSQTKQVVQITLEDADLLAQRHYPQYQPGVTVNSGLDPSVPLTPDTPDLVNFEPSFSPDGNTLIYVRREDATHMSMYTMPVADGVTNDPNNLQFNPNTPANLQKALVPYNQSSKLLTNEFLSQPVWSPDGTQIAYYSYTNTVFDLWLATVVKDPKTGIASIKPNSAVQITSAHGDLDADSRPDWVQ